MKNLTLRKLNTILKEAGLESAHASSSGRVSGWSSYASEGFIVENLAPWTTYYVRNGRRLTSQLNEQNVSVVYSVGYDMNGQRKNTKYTQETGLEVIKKALSDAGVTYTEAEYYTGPRVDLVLSRV